MAAKRQKLKLSKRLPASESNVTKVNNVSLTRDKSLNETSLYSNVDSSFTSDVRRRSDILHKLRKQLQHLQNDKQQVQFSAFPVFKVNDSVCLHKGTCSVSEPKWTPFPELCLHCATDVPSKTNGTNLSQNQDCAISQLLTNYHEGNLNKNQLDSIGKTSDFIPGTPESDFSDDDMKLDCMMSPDLFTCQSSVEPKPRGHRVTSSSSSSTLVTKTLFPVDKP